MNKQKATKRKIKESKKGVNGILVQVGTLVAMFAPQVSEQYQAAVAVVGSVLTALTVYYSTNHKAEEVA